MIFCKEEEEEEEENTTNHNNEGLFAKGLDFLLMLLMLKDSKYANSLLKTIARKDN